MGVSFRRARGRDRHRRLVLGLLLASGMSAAVSCGTEDRGGPRTPLLDDRHVPEILIERPRIALPPDDDANRFLSGWFPWPYEGRVALGASAAGARLQIVHLEARGRTLALDLVETPPPGAVVRVRVDGRELGTFPLADPIEIPLPEDLPAGTVLVEVAPVGSPPPPLDVLAAAVRPVLPAGTVRQEGHDLIQTGSSRVVLVRPVRAGQELVGELVPPASPRPGQRFRLAVSDDRDRELASFEWTGGWWDRLRGRRRFRLPAGERAGRVAVTLDARGGGPPARWRNLGWRVGDPGPAPERPRGPAAEPPRLVLLYVMDALRADHVGHLGGPAGISPHLDRLAREGFTFLDHRSVAASTLPSTRALFSGHPQRSETEWRAASRGGPLLAERFRQAGYRTGLFSGNGYLSAPFGLDRGFDHVAEEVVFGQPAAGEGGGAFNDNAARVHRAALAWLETLGPGERAFLYLHTIHPHNPYAPPPDLAERFAAGIASSIDGRTDTLLAVQDGGREVDAADRERLRALYAASFAYNDRELGALVEALRARFAGGEVLLIVTSDHGEELFDHGGVLHGYTFYEEMIRIPLVLWWPGGVEPGSSHRATSTLDLHATLLDLLGAEEARSGGRSLLPRALGEEGDRDGAWSLPEHLHFAAAPGVRGGIFAVQSGTAKLVAAAPGATTWGMGKGRGRSRDPGYFFDLRSDPHERHNQVGKGGLEERWLRSRLRAWMRAGEAVGEEGPPGEEPALDAETRERLRSLGYLD